MISFSLWTTHHPISIKNDNKYTKISYKPSISLVMWTGVLGLWKQGRIIVQEKKLLYSERYVLYSLCPSATSSLKNVQCLVLLHAVLASDRYAPYRSPPKKGIFFSYRETYYSIIFPWSNMIIHTLRFSSSILYQVACQGLFLNRN